MKAERRKDSSPKQGIRGEIILLCAVVLLAVLFTVGLRRRGAEPTPTTEAPELAVTGADNPAPSSEVSRPNPRPGLPTPANVRLPPATPYARQLVNAVSRLDRTGAPLAFEEANEWKNSMERLVQQGPAGISAIMEFLEKRTDVAFGREGRALVGFESARAALFDALVQIGGAEGLSATLQVIHSTGDPLEVALLAQNLEKLAPDVYRAEALNAARKVLGMASSGKAPSSTDVAPLFEVFQHYGGSEVVADLEQARQHWEYYSVMTLAQLPEGAGIPSLIQIVQANSDGTMTALELLAQLSGRYAEARSALLEMTRRNGISSAWPHLVTALAGNEYYFQNSAFVGQQGRAHPDNVSIAHIKSGNQTFYSAFSRGSLTPEQLKEQIAFIDELRSVTSDPVGLEALQQSMDLLLTRQPMMAAASP